MMRLKAILVVFTLCLSVSDAFAQSGESPLALLYDAETAKRSHRYIASFLEELFN